MRDARTSEHNALGSFESLQANVFAGVFGERRLYLGGPMQTNRMHALHTQAGISGATGLLPGVFVGGLEDLLEKVLSGDCSASGVRYPFVRNHTNSMMRITTDIAAKQPCSVMT